MTLENPGHPAPVVGNFYEWQGPAKTFYMGECTSVQGAAVTFDNGPKMLDDGRYRRCEPARALIIPVYKMAEGVRA